MPILVGRVSRLFHLARLCGACFRSSSVDGTFRLRRLSSGPGKPYDIDLTPAEMALRSQILAETTLAETAVGKKAFIQATQQMLKLKREAILAAQLAELEIAKQDKEGNMEPAEAAREAGEGAVEKSKETPLLNVLRSRLKLGPLPINEYMSLTMSHPEHGYYMTREVFGAQGDFITAPEISQVLFAAP